MTTAEKMTQLPKQHDRGGIGTDLTHPAITAGQKRKARSLIVRRQPQHAAVILAALGLEEDAA